MTRHTVTLLAAQMDEAWENLRHWVEDLTEQEFFWEPAPGCWTAHPDASGRWVLDYALPHPDPPSLTTIAWRLIHIATCKLMYHEYAFGPGELTWDELEIPHTVADTLALLEEGHTRLRRALDDLNDADLERERLTNWGEPWPAWRIFWTMVCHDLEHGAEIGCLRDLRRVAADRSIHGGVEHLPVAGHKPRWRAALRQIAGRLNEAEAPYKLVGSASVALHGVPVREADLDIETSASGAYRFQELFSRQVVEPVSLCESETYRSHFGRFDFDGVSVEVMGDLHRREGERWVPTAATTATRVELDGLPVRVSWLEEETLAYIRRGRLERAARCLPHCDHSRLLALLRGEKATGVL